MAKFSGGRAGIVGKPDFAIALGLLTPAWSLVESSLILALQFLLQTPYYKAEIVLYSLANSKAKQDIVTHLAGTIKDETIKKEFLEIMKEISSISRRRNSLIHGDWVTALDGGAVFLMNRQPSTKSQAKMIEIKIESIIEIVNRCNVVQDRMFRFFADMPKDQALEAFA